MSLWKEPNKLYASINSYEEENDEHSEIQKLLDWLNNKKVVQKYKEYYNNLDFNSKERVLEITLTWLNSEYKWKLDKKEANAFLFIYALDFILCIKEYENNRNMKIIRRKNKYHLLS